MCQLTVQEVVAPGLSPLALRFVDEQTALLVADSGRLHLLDFEGRKVTPGAILTLSPPDPKLPSTGDTHPSRAAFLPDGKKVAAEGISTGLRILEVETGREVLRLDGGDLLAISPDGNVLAIASSRGLGRVKRGDRMLRHRSSGISIEASGGTIRLVDAHSGREMHRMAVEGSQVWAMAFSPDGKTLATATGWEAGLIQLIDIAGGAEVRRIEAPPLRTPALSFTPDGSRLVSGMADGSVLVWDARPEAAGR